MLGWLAIGVVCATLVLIGVGLLAAAMTACDQHEDIDLTEPTDEPTDEPKKQRTLKPPKSWHHKSK